MNRGILSLFLLPLAGLAQIHTCSKPGIAISVGGPMAKEGSSTTAR
jgi:hypothetical protein